MHKLLHQDFHHARALFRKLDYQLIITTVLERNSPGEIFVDDLHAPASALMVSPEGNFLAGNAQNPDFNAHLKGLLVEKMGAEHSIEILFDDPAWVNSLAELFQIEYPLVFEASYYEFRAPLVLWREKLPPGFSMSLVDQAFLDRQNLENQEIMLEKIKTNWGDEKVFLERGVGCCLLLDNLIVSECLADCVSGERCEIGISTDPRFRRQGLAALTVAATVEQCQARGLTEIGWHCANNNLGSIKTAEKVGFEKQLTYPIFELIPGKFRNLCANGAFAVFCEHWQEAIAFFENAFRLQTAPARYYYLAAVAYAMDGDHERVYPYLEKALTHGAVTLEEIKADARLESFCASPQWGQLCAVWEK